MPKVTILHLLFLSLFLTGCLEEETITNKITGTIVDGYIQGATVCIDENSNTFCDSSEYKTTSDINGYFELDSPEYITQNANIIAIGGYDTAIHENFDGTFQYTLSTVEETNNIQITLFSTISNLIYKKGLTSNSNYTLDMAKDILVSNYDINKSQIDKNPLKDKELFVQTQKLIQTIKILNKIMANNDTQDTQESEFFNFILEQSAYAIMDDASTQGVFDVKNITKRLKTSAYYGQTLTVSTKIDDFLSDFSNSTLTKIDSNSNTLNDTNMSQLQNAMNKYILDANLKILNDQDELLKSDVLDKYDNKTAINLFSIGDNEPAIIKNEVFYINENDTTTSFKPTITSDSKDVLTYSLGKKDSNFNISTTGYVNFILPANYENQTQYKITYIVNDGINISSQELVINIVDISDIDPIIYDLSVSVDENISSGTKIGTIQFKQKGDSDIISIDISGVGSEKFISDNSGVIRLNNTASLDYETKTNYDLNITATNSSGTSEIKTLTITINNIPDIIPVLLDTNITLDESLEGVFSTQHKIRMLSSGDLAPDYYKLIGSGYENFSISNNGKINIEANASLDFATKSIYNFTVQGFSSVENTNIANLTINLVFLSKVPPELDYTVAEANESDASGILIGTMTVASSGDTPVSSFSITSQNDNDQRFRINDNGEIYLKEGKSLDYETEQYINISVFANNQCVTNSNTQTFKINVLNAPDTVPNLNDQSINALGDVAANTVIGNTDIIINYDIIPISSYKITGTNSSDISIDASGKIIINKTYDLEYNESVKYDLEVVATNFIGDSTKSDLEIVVTNDYDDDYIADSIELMIGKDPRNKDEDSDGIKDGKQNSGDKFFYKQWYIYNTGEVYNPDATTHETSYNDLGLMDIYHKYMGKGVVIQIVDSGVEYNHKDLIQNMSLSKSVKSGEGTYEYGGDPTPVKSGNSHGTKVAGIAAARGFNNNGVRGVAPFATIAGSNYLEYQDIHSLSAIWDLKTIDVSNNSWGTYYSDCTDSYASILNYAAHYGRDGKGTNFVFAAGNDRRYSGNVAYQCSFTTKSVIFVAALTNQNLYTEYSSFGPSILVSAYGGGSSIDDSPTITTTTLSNSSPSNETWDEDYDRSYTKTMNGTSSAAPMVSGVIALVLEACPDLTNRDIRRLIATTAKQVEPTSVFTQTLRKSGLKYSLDYGFGLINAKGMIDACTSDTYTQLPEETSYAASKILDVKLPGTSTINFKLDIPKDMTAEYVELYIESNHTMSTDIQIKIKSPNSLTNLYVLKAMKTSSPVIGKSYWEYLRDDLGVHDAPNDWMNINGGFRIGISAFMNIAAMGEWSIDIKDDVNNDHTGSIKYLKLVVYGHY